MSSNEVNDEIKLKPKTIKQTCAKCEVIHDSNINEWVYVAILQPRPDCVRLPLCSKCLEEWNGVREAQGKEMTKEILGQEKDRLRSWWGEAIVPLNENEGDE